MKRRSTKAMRKSARKSAKRSVRRGRKYSGKKYSGRKYSGKHSGKHSGMRRHSGKYSGKHSGSHSIEHSGMYGKHAYSGMRHKFIRDCETSSSSSDSDRSCRQRLYCKKCKRYHYE